MHETILQTIYANGLALSDSQKAFQKAIEENRDSQGNGIDISLTVPETDYSLSDIDAAIIFFLSFIKNIDTSEQSIVTPRSYLENLATKITELKNQIDAVRTALEAIKTQGGIKTVDKKNFVITAQNGNQTNVVKHIRRIYSLLDSALAAWFQLRLVINSPRLAEFGGMLDAVAARQTDVSRLVDENVKLGKIVGDEQKKISNLFSQANSERDEVGRLLKESQNDRKSLSEYAAEGAQKIAAVQTSHQEATALAASVNEYKANFKRFDDQLKSREEKFVKENADLDTIHKRLNSDEDEIKRLTSEAEGMLRGATTVGLASSFSSLQEKINSELKWARYSFYFSILMLMILSLPIALYVFPGLQLFLKAATGIDVSILVPKGIESHTTPDIVAQVLARALLLIPGIWLVRFTGARHERLFRLREHYSYKYSIASSVEGFKRQAPSLEEGIAATAFFELTFNPATRMDANSSEGRHPNPAMEWVMKKLGEAREENKQSNFESLYA